MSAPATRRTLLIGIGQAALGAGIARAFPGGTAAPLQLPPGVYLASSDHLSHALASAERQHPIPPGCPTDYVRPGTGAYAPLFFSASEFKVISRLVELMLGEADDDGANNTCKEVAEWIDLRLAGAAAVREAARQINTRYRALAVAYFGPDRVRETEIAVPETICRDGLAWLANAGASDAPDGFLALPSERQTAIVMSMSDMRPDSKTDNAGTHFLAWLKPEVIRGFYTSQAGLHELDYKGNSFYARSPGCDRAV